MGSIVDLAYVSNMAANRKPFLTDLTETLDSIQTYVNSTSTDAINDILIDSWPSGYATTADGTGRFVNSDLYDKLSAVDTYTGGNVTIAAVGAWTNVDATNAAITFTPDYLAGDFLVTFQFNISVVTTNAVNEAQIRFRLTDSTSNSDAIANVHFVTGVNATTTVVPVTLQHEFGSLTAAAHTVLLQYFIVTTTATTIVVRANTDSPIAMEAHKI